MPIHKSDIYRLPLARRFLRRNSWFDPAINCTHVVGIRRATEQLAEHLGSAVGGLINVTFGNAAELILALFVLSSGNATVVKGHAAEQAGLAHPVDPVPTHMRNLEPGDAKAGHIPRQQAETVAAVALVAVLEEKLVAKTNAKHRKPAQCSTRRQRARQLPVIRNSASGRQ